MYECSECHTGDPNRHYKTCSKYVAKKDPEEVFIQDHLNRMQDLQSLGKWAEKHGIKALKEICEDRNTWTACNKAYPTVAADIAQKAIDALPKEVQL